MPVFFKPVQEPTPIKPHKLPSSSVASSVVQAAGSLAAFVSGAAPSAAAAAAPSDGTTPGTILDLPVEIISHILSYLPLETIVRLAQESPFVQSVCVSPTLHPFLSPISDILSSARLYPPALGRLGAYTFVPRKVYIDLLVRGKPDWVLFDFQQPSWLEEEDWHEVCQRRFLPSFYGKEWKKDLTWRALYLRTLSRISHRSRSSCSIDEPYTRWINLDRRGTATVNRLRSNGFNPLEIYPSMRSQSHAPPPQTTVRPVVRLIDVTVYAIGVLDRPTSIFVNPNAFDFLHPPLLIHQVAEALSEPKKVEGKGKGREGRERAFSEGGAGLLDEGRSIAWASAPSDPTTASRPAPPSHSATYSGRRSRARSTEREEPSSSTTQRKPFSIPLSRTLSGGKSSSPHNSLKSGWRDSMASASSSFGSMFRSSARREPTFDTNVWVATAAAPPYLLELSPVPSTSSSPRSAALRLPTRSADSSGRTSPRRTSAPGGQGATTTTSASSSASATPPSTVALPPINTSLTFVPPQVHLNSQPLSPVPSVATLTPSPRPARAEPPRRLVLPYRPQLLPSPSESFRLYPNHTPGGFDTRMRPAGKIWVDEVTESREEGEGERKWDEVEWPEMEDVKQWVGPLMIVAVLNSPDSTVPPPLPDPTDDPHLNSLFGPTTTFTSFDAPDLWAVAPWLRDNGSGKGVTGSRVWGGVGFLREEGLDMDP